MPVCIGYYVDWDWVWQLTSHSWELILLGDELKLTARLLAIPFFVRGKAAAAKEVQLLCLKMDEPARLIKECLLSTIGIPNLFLKIDNIYP